MSAEYLFDEMDFIIDRIRDIENYIANLDALPVYSDQPDIAAAHRRCRLYAVDGLAVIYNRYTEIDEQIIELDADASIE